MRLRDVPRSSLNRGDRSAWEIDADLGMAQLMSCPATAQQQEQIQRLGGKVRDGLTRYEAGQYLKALHKRPRRRTP